MIVVLLPAYNEEESLPQIMPKIASILADIGESHRIIVCNDGSNDETQSMLEKYSLEMPIEILTHKLNRGLGESMRDLFERANEITQSGDIIIRLDCDDTHDPIYIPSIIEKIREGFDVVVASRFLENGGQTGVEGYRAFISRGATLFMRLFFPIPGLKEYTCGFRGYRADMIRQAIEFYGNDFVQLKGLGFTCTLEKLVKLNMLGARFGEVPFILKYNQKLSSSKMVSSITTLGYITMAILYHWPFGGWRRGYSKKIEDMRASIE